MNVTLLGARASGKTTIGRQLAQLLGWSFVDLDDLARQQFAETTVQDIWQAHGEPAWREAEGTALRTSLARDRQVIALGGGTPTIPAAAELMRLQQQSDALFAIYLHADSKVLRDRLAAEAGDRPSLTGAQPADEIAVVTAQRDETYRNVADHICHTDGRSIDEIVAELTLLIAEQSKTTEASGDDRHDACG